MHCAKFELLVVNNNTELRRYSLGTWKIYSLCERVTNISIRVCVLVAIQNIPAFANDWHDKNEYFHAILLCCSSMKTVFPATNICIYE